MADLQTTYISDLAQGSIQDSTLFITDDGTNTNSATAADVANFAKDKILPEANSYADAKKGEAVEESKGYVNGVISNPNLLRNSKFNVWQRGESFTADGYTADMWKIVSSGTGANITKMTDGGINFSYTTANYINCIQFIENSYKGENVTFSAMVKGNAGTPIRLAIGKTTNINIAIGYQDFLATGDWQTLSYTNVLTDDDIVFVLIRSGANCTNFSIKWAKLEIGKEATRYIPKPYYQELLDCQRYFYVIPTVTFFLGGTVNTLSANGILTLPTIMRTTPTLIAGNAEIYARGSGVANTKATSFRVFSLKNNILTFAIDLPSNFQTYQMYQFYTYLDIKLDASIY